MPLVSVSQRANHVTSNLAVFDEDVLFGGRTVNGTSDPVIQVLAGQQRTAELVWRSNLYPQLPTDCFQLSPQVNASDRMTHVSK
jgi:hypothetical protein